MKLLVNMPTCIDDALEEAKTMGFENRFVFRGKKILCPAKNKEYLLNDIAVVYSIEVLLDGEHKGLLCYTVSCDGELGVVIDKTKTHHLTRLLAEKN